MDRTVLDTWKAEEKELSAKLYNSLQSLAALYPTSDEFQKHLTLDIFLKPEKEALFHVMHYMFHLLDPQEFKKRFYWPITDKRSESIFRSSTVEYLNHLNEKYQLHLTNIKSHIMVKPGGMKFIKFMTDFVTFVLQELIRKREKSLCAKFGVTQLPKRNLNHMLRENEFLKEYASAYINELDAKREKMLENTRLLKAELNELANTSGVDFDQFTSEPFLREFKLSNQKLFEQKYSVKAKKIGMLEQPLQELKAIVDTFQSKAVEVKYDKDTVKQSLQFLKEKHHMKSQENNDCSLNNDEGIKMNDLINGFNLIHDSIEVSLNEVNNQPVLGEFVAKELNALKSEILQMEVQITDFQKELNSKVKNQNITERANDSQRPLLYLPEASGQNTLLSKFVSTPPINFNVMDGRNVIQTRLPLLDDLDAECTNITGRKLKLNEQSFDLNTSNRTGIIGPLELLRTIEKYNNKPKAAGQVNLYTLDSKRKELQNDFVCNIDSIGMPDKAIVGLTIDESENVETPYITTPFNSNDQTRVSRRNQIYDTNSNSLALPKNLSAMMKVQEESFNIGNLSMSPSGRLEPLVKLNDDTLQLDISDEINKVRLSNSFLEILKRAENELIDSDNDLFNISDSVLKDVL